MCVGVGVYVCECVCVCVCNICAANTNSPYSSVCVGTCGCVRWMWVYECVGVCEGVCVCVHRVCCLYTFALFLWVGRFMWVCAVCMGWVCMRMDGGVCGCHFLSYALSACVRHILVWRISLMCQLSLLHTHTHTDTHTHTLTYTHIHAHTHTHTHTHIHTYIMRERAI